MGRKQTYVVKLNDEERKELKSIVRTGHRSGRVIRRAQTLLWIDQGKSDREITDFMAIREILPAMMWMLRKSQFLPCTYFKPQ